MDRAMAESRVHGGGNIPCNRKRNPTLWGHHPSYNVAKKVVEFEYQEEIPRYRLRAAYGEGFKGAPLRCQLSGEGAFPPDARTCDGKAAQAPSSLSQEDHFSGGSHHV